MYKINKERERILSEYKERSNLHHKIGNTEIDGNLHKLGEIIQEKEMSANQIKDEMNSVEEKIKKVQYTKIQMELNNMKCVIYLIKVENYCIRKQKKKSNESNGRNKTKKRRTESPC